MTSTTTIPAAVAAARMIRDWRHGNILGSLSMGEGYTLATLFAQLDQSEVAQHIIREVWEGEAADSRDPLPWANAHGSRLSDEDHAAVIPGEGDERFHFVPRLAFEDQLDVIAYWAARECADCGAYDGPLFTHDGVTRCAVCRTDN